MSIDSDTKYYHLTTSGWYVRAVMLTVQTMLLKLYSDIESKGTLALSGKLQIQQFGTQMILFVKNCVMHLVMYQIK